MGGSDMKKVSDKVRNTESKTLNDVSPMSSLRAKLKTVDLEIQHYVAALETENLKLQKQVGKMQAQNVRLRNSITILKENIEELKRQNEASALVGLVETIRKQMDKK